MIRLLHAADFHLDSAFSALPPERAAERRQEQRFALQALSALCRERGCDAVLLSGDLFDSARIYRDTLDALRRFCADCGAEVFIAAGKRDYLSPGSPYLTEAWPENIHIFPAQEISCVSVERLHLNVYGASFTAPEAPALLEGFRVSDPQAVNVMVLHGDTQPASPYNSVTSAQIAASGLDYLALGHIHAAGFVKAGKTLCAWPGCLMGRGFDECGQKGALRVELDELKEADFYRILTEPSNAITKQYQQLLATEGVNLVFNDEALHRLAQITEQMNTQNDNIGARRLFTIMGALLEGLSFAANELSGQPVTITREYVDERLKDVLGNQDRSRYIL